MESIFTIFTKRLCILGESIFIIFNQYLGKAFSPRGSVFQQGIDLQHIFCKSIFTKRWDGSLLCIFRKYFHQAALYLERAFSPRDGSSTHILRRYFHQEMGWIFTWYLQKVFLPRCPVQVQAKQFFHFLFSLLMLLIASADNECKATSLKSTCQDK